eukprot:scaffold23623_cov17-Tisochrysis_lutea.AAC.3
MTGFTGISLNGLAPSIIASQEPLHASQLLRSCFCAVRRPRLACLPVLSFQAVRLLSEHSSIDQGNTTRGVQLLGPRRHC